MAALVWLLGAHLMTEPQPQAGRQTAWPYGLGTIDDVPKRFPRSNADATAAHVAKIAAGLSISASSNRRISLQSYVSEQIARTDGTIAPPPAEIRRFLDDHVAALDELRTLLDAGAAPHWAVNLDDLFHGSMPDLAAELQLFRILAADALDHQRRGDSITAWRDTQAGWTLAKGSWGQPNLISVVIALSGSRMMNEVAASLASPAPAWFRELATFDADRAVAGGMQAEAWQALAMAKRFPAGEPDDDAKRAGQAIHGVAGALLRPSQLRHAASEAATLRDAAIELSQSKSCGAGARSPAMQNFAVLWRRLNRFRIDREAAQKLLALKEQRRIAGTWPESLPGIEQSSCSDGSWRYHREPNGSMSLSYAGPITTHSNDSAGLPLSFHYSK